MSRKRKQMYIEDRLFWRLEDILKVRQAKIEKQIPVWEAEWDLEESKVQAYYEAILKMVQSARGGALTDLKKARLASETQIKAVKDHLLAQKQRITPLKGIREQVCGLKQQLQTLLVQVEAPLRLNVRPLIQHTLPNVDLKNLQTSINLVNVRVATVHEVLVECYDDVHPAFNIDLVGIIDSYCQMGMLRGDTIFRWEVQIANGLCVLEGKRVAVGGIGYIRIWDYDSGKMLQDIKLDTERVMSLAYLGDDRLVCGGDGTDPTLQILNLKSGECVRTMEGHSKLIWTLSAFPDGIRVASGSDDGSICVWDTKSGECKVLLKKCAHSVSSVLVFNKGHQLLSCGQDKLVRLWNVDTGYCVREMKGHTGSVSGLTLVNGEKQVVSVSYDKTLRLWDIETGKCLRVMRGHIAICFAVVTLSDGIRVVSSGRDKTLRVWDTSTGECLQMLVGHTDNIHRLCVTPQDLVVSASHDNSIRVWH